MSQFTNYPNGATSFGIPLIGGSIPSGMGNYIFVDGANGAAGNSGESPEAAISTITGGLAKVTSGNGDVLVVAPGSYDETVTVTKSTLTIVGLGGLGATFIEPQTAGAEGMQVTLADDVTLVNIGIACDDTGDYALNLNSARRFRAFGCKIEGQDTTGSIVLCDGTASRQTADVLFQNCEFAYGAKCFTFDDSAYGYPTQIMVDGCRFRDITTNMFGINTNGLVLGLYVTNCVFGNTEANVAPTDYILLSSNSNTGFFAGNQFATATNATGVLTIGTGIMWGPNGTEAGFSTARPS